MYCCKVLTCAAYRALSTEVPCHGNFQVEVHPFTVQYLPKRRSLSSRNCRLGVAADAQSRNGSLGSP